MPNQVALIVGAGPGISGAFGEALVAAGHTVALAARDLGRLAPMAAAFGSISKTARRSCSRPSRDRT